MFVGIRDLEELGCAFRGNSPTFSDVQDLEELACVWRRSSPTFADVQDLEEVAGTFRSNSSTSNLVGRGPRGQAKWLVRVGRQSKGAHRSILSCITKILLVASRIVKRLTDLESPHRS